MAEPDRTVATTFPPPPPFWKHFTHENMAKLNELRAAQDTTTSLSESKKLSQRKSLAVPKRILDLPRELLFLQPPLLPASGIYRVFGEKYTLKEELPSLAQQGVEQLYDIPPATPSGTDNHQDFGFLLKKLTKSLLLNFLELVGIMSINPELANAKLDDLKTHFANIHHLINQYRPHEARESFIILVEEQVERAKAETDGIYAMKKKVEAVLDGLRNIQIPEAENLMGPQELEAMNELEEGYNVWEALRKEFD